MNIVARIDELLNGEGKWKSMLDHFLVSGIPRRNASVVFIGESPHTDEVLSGCTPDSRYPLVGESGKTVTDALRDILPRTKSDQPIGQLATDESVSWLSIINISEVPLDVGVYHQLVTTRKVTPNLTEWPSLEHWLKLMYSFGLFKKGAVERGRRGKFVNDVEKKIKEDFSCRSELAIGCKTKLVILLGNTAKTYYKLNCSELGVETKCVPHPSPKSKASDKWKCPNFHSEIQGWCRSAIQ